MNPDGTEPVNLTNTPESEGSVSISADGSKIVFMSSGVLFPAPIWVMDFDGSNRRQLEATLSADTNKGPAISPLGDQIAYNRLAYQDDPLGVSGWDIVVLNTDGTGFKILELPGNQRGRLSWSPAGDKILYVRSQNSNADIWAVNSDGSNPVRLTNDPASDRNPVWSPDGTKIAYTSGGESNIYVMNADGSDPIQLTDLPTIEFPVGHRMDRRSALHQKEMGMQFSIS